MHAEEGKFRQTEATVIKSMKKSSGKGRIEVMNIKVRFRNNSYLDQPGQLPFT